MREKDPCMEGEGVGQHIRQREQSGREGQFGLRISVKGTGHEGNNKCKQG